MQECTKLLFEVLKFYTTYKNLVCIFDGLEQKKVLVP